MFSKAGRLVIIKAVLNNLLIYYLGLLKMSKTVAKKIISMRSRFLWGKESGKGSLPTICWSQIQLPKELAGLGMGDILLKNATMLFKW